MASIAPNVLNCTPEQHTSKHGYVRLSISSITQNVATNQTTVNYSITIQGTPYVTLHALYVTLGGRVLYSNTSGSIKSKWYAGALIKSGTETFNNNNNGSLTLNAYIKQLFYYNPDFWNNSSYYQSSSVSMVCSQIQRKAEITFAQDFDSNGSPTIRFSNPAGLQVIPYINFRAYGDYSGPVLKQITRAKENYTSPYSFNLTQAEKESILNALNNDYRFSATEGLNTYYGDTWLDYSSQAKVFTIIENNSTRPSVTLSVSCDNTLIPSAVRSTFADMYIQGKSKVGVTISATPKYSATISTYSTAIDGRSYATSIFTSYPLVTPESQVIQSTVTDSRGFINTATQNISVYAYSKPWIEPIAGSAEIRCYRSDASGNPTNDSTRIWVKAKKAFYSLNNKNSCTLRYRYKLSSEVWGNQEWTTLQTVDDEYDALISGAFPVTNSYTIQIGVIDTFGEYDSLDFDVPTDDVPLHLGEGGKSVGIGRYADTSKDHSVSVGWDTYFSGEVYISNKKLEDYIVDVIRNCTAD